MADIQEIIAQHEIIEGYLDETREHELEAWIRSLKPKLPRGRLTARQKQQGWQLLGAATLKVAELAHDLGCSQPTLYRRFHGGGLPRHFTAKQALTVLKHIDVLIAKLQRVRAIFLRIAAEDSDT